MCKNWHQKLVGIYTHAMASNMVGHRHWRRQRRRRRAFFPQYHEMTMMKAWQGSMRENCVLKNNLTTPTIYVWDCYFPHIYYTPPRLHTARGEKNVVKFYSLSLSRSLARFLCQLGKWKWMFMMRTIWARWRKKMFFHVWYLLSTHNAHPHAHKYDITSRVIRGNVHSHTEVK
jgi:hypothetical protein